MNESNQEKLIQMLGLTKKEIAVYLACLELGAASVQEVAEKAGVKRTSIYNFLEDMKGRGLVSAVRHGKKMMLVAEDPHELLRSVQENQKKLESQLPFLMSIYNAPGNKPKVRFYQGVSGLKRIYEDTLISRAEFIYEVSDYERMFKVMEPAWMWEYARRRAERGIKALSIAQTGKRADMVQKRDVKQLRETKFVSQVEFATEVNIYANKVAFLSFRKPYAGVIIEDMGIHQTMKTMWDLVWNVAAK